MLRPGAGGIGTARDWMSSRTHIFEKVFHFGIQMLRTAAGLLSLRQFSQIPNAEWRPSKIEAEII